MPKKYIGGFPIAYCLRALDMDFSLELNDLFSDVKSVVSDPFKFKRSLKIGDEAFVYLNNAKNTLDCIESVGMGVGAGSLAYFGWAASLGIIGQIGLALGITTTPIGWIVGAGALGTAGAYGFRKIRNKAFSKVEDRTIEKIPKYINTPLDVIGMNVADILMPPAIRIARADGDFCEREKAAIVNHFVDVWGFDRPFIQEYVAERIRMSSRFDLNEYCKDIRTITRKIEELRWESVSAAILEIMQDVMNADGIVHEAESRELETFRVALSREGG